MAKTTGFTKDLIFVSAAESVFATLTAPIAADAIYVIEAPTFKHPLPMLPDPQRRNSASQLVQLRDKSDTGTFSFKCFLKQSGTAGTAVQAGLHQAITGAMGRAPVVVGGTSVTYSLLRNSDTLPSYSIFWRNADGEVLQHAGCIFTKLTVSIVAKGAESLLQATFEGIFAQQYRAGRTVTIAGSTTTAVILASGAGQFFDAGALITVTGLTPLPTTITSIATDTLTVPTLSGAPAADVAVLGYIPTPTESGNILSGWRGHVTLGGTNLPVTKVDIVWEAKHEILTDEKVNTDGATSFIANAGGVRDCTAIITHYFDPTSAIGGANKWYNALNQVQQALVMNVGNVAGKIWTFNAPIAELMDTPDLDTSGKNMITLKYRCLGSSSLDDEVSQVLT